MPESDGPLSCTIFKPHSVNNEVIDIINMLLHVVMSGGQNWYMTLKIWYCIEAPCCVGILATESCGANLSCWIWQSINAQDVLIWRLFSTGTKLNFGLVLYWLRKIFEVTLLRIWILTVAAAVILLNNFLWPLRIWSSPNQLARQKRKSLNVSHAPWVLASQTLAVSAYNLLGNFLDVLPCHWPTLLRCLPWFRPPPSGLYNT